MSDEHDMLRELVRRDVDDALSDIRARLDVAEAARLVLTEQVAALTAQHTPEVVEEIQEEVHEAAGDDMAPEAVVEGGVDDESEGEPDPVEDAAQVIEAQIEQTADEIAPHREHFLTRRLGRRDL